MIDAAQLTADLKKLVLTVEDDLRARVDGADMDGRQEGVFAAWDGEYRAAREAGRTARTWTEWRDDRVTQAAVAWVLTTVFVRFCEDNGLLKQVWIAGPKSRRQEAADARSAYFRAHPTDTDREWLLQPVEYLRGIPATRDLVESRSALWTVAPSAKAAERILAFWHEQDDTGELRRDFTDPELSTRFLGDLYQDLSDHAKKTYALLQTPEFVEEFILDRTMEPALKERRLEGFRLIDPTCGSGHFLLGAFGRLVEKWRVAEPGTNITELVRRALGSVYGVDLNPFAVAIARFRLIIAALQACGESSLENAPDWEQDLHLTSGDSLWDWANFLPGEMVSFAYATEDPDRLAEYLTPGSYDVVVGNPPYITVKDKALNKKYRELYSACKGTYALTVPFMQRFFELARKGSERQAAGWVGQITSNSFMKREFGSKLIEEFFPRQDLRLVVDTSGAHIPGHGTPTVILVGRRQPPVGDNIRAVLGIRGEPGRPSSAAEGVVWRSITDHVDSVAHQDDYTSTADVSRESLSSHPWSLSGGGADQLLTALQGSALGEHVKRIGFMAMSHADEQFTFRSSVAFESRHGHPDMIPLVTGTEVRDWIASSEWMTWFPYQNGEKKNSKPAALGWRILWINRSNLESRATFSGTYKTDGRDWWEWHQVPRDVGTSPLSIAFAFVATHNHFVLDRGGKVFKQSAPVIKLPEGASEDEHLALLGVLNSSTACFWLKQNSHQKAAAAMGGGMIDQPWSWNWEFTGTTLKDFPLPASTPLKLARALDFSARELAEIVEAPFAPETVPTPASLEHARVTSLKLRGRMVALQEELDWWAYGAYGLIDADSVYDGWGLPDINPGERPFAIALARKMAAGTEASRWFTHSNHNHRMITEIPSHWPEAYRDLVQRRLDLIESDKFINLLERPEYKRRWQSEPWEKRVERKLREWLLDHLEDRRYWFDEFGRPRSRSVAQLADEVSRDDDLRSTLELWAGQNDIDVAKTLEKLFADEVVPFLAAWRLKEPGLRKRREWERTWELQRAEDRGENVGDIPVPPKYATADFRKQSYWSHRGKLDVPKERFISYPGGNRETDPSTLLGWAGWDHAQQSLALATLINERAAEGMSDDALTPLVAGMAELEPWVLQWHNATDESGINLAEFLRATLDDHLSRLATTRDDLLDWRPPALTRGRRARKAQ